MYYSSPAGIATFSSEVKDCLRMSKCIFWPKLDFTQDREVEIIIIHELYDLFQTPLIQPTFSHPHLMLPAYSVFSLQNQSSLVINFHVARSCSSFSSYFIFVCKVPLSTIQCAHLISFGPPDGVVLSIPPVAAFGR